MMWDIETDVVVVGAGGCGLIAALTAAEQGMEVVLLEKTPWVLGNTGASSGMIPAAGTRFQREQGIVETAEDMARDIFDKNGNESDPEVTLKLCRTSREVVEWLADGLGLDMELVTEFRYPGHSQLRMHALPSRSGLDFVKRLKQAVNQRDNIYLLLEADVQELIADDQRAVCGVRVSTKTGNENIRCKKVILACNGFGGNRQMVMEYIPDMQEALYFGYEANTGDGIRWGIKLGAELANMNGFQGHASVAIPHGILLSWGAVMNGGFLVNQAGRRFGDETQGYSEYALEVLKQEQGIAYAIFDQPIYDSLIKIEDFNKSIEMGAIKRAQTAEELAELFQLDPSTFSETLGSFNDSIKIGEDQYGRRHDGNTLLKAPFYGVKVTGALFHTQGGLRVNSDAQVLDKHGMAIPNLYAGGGTAAGVSGNSAKGYMSGNGLLAALGFGRIAGMHAAQQVLLEQAAIQ